jgi:hypothetical protein
VSADSIGICPNCYSQKTGKPLAEITIQDLNEGWDHMTNELREFYENYIDKGCVVSEFEATCRECNWHVQTTSREPFNV